MGTKKHDLPGIEAALAGGVSGIAALATMDFAKQFEKGPCNESTQDRTLVVPYREFLGHNHYYTSILSGLGVLFACYAFYLSRIFGKNYKGNF